jgi:hypothetical protein
MKKANSASAELRPEYKRSDFGKLERGKYYKRLMASSNVVVLEPDVAALFPNSAAVNDALRSLAKLAANVSGLIPGSSRQARLRRSSREFAERRKAMQAVVGIWKDRREFADPEKHVRQLGRDTRLQRLMKDRH